MFVLVTGGSASGKSEYAESLLLEGPESESLMPGRLEPESLMPGRLESESPMSGSMGQKSGRVYLATMEPFGSEAAARIARHRKLREGKGFETVECPVNIGACSGICRGRHVLLEDLPNLVANEIFGNQAENDFNGNFGPDSDFEADMGFGSDSNFEADTAHGSYTSIIKKITAQILELADVSESLICVTGILTADGRKYDESTMGYLRALACIEQTLAAHADQVIEVVSGVTNVLKAADTIVSNANVNALRLRMPCTGVDVSNLRQMSLENKDGTAREHRMIFVTGPMFSGKRKYIKSALGLDDEEFGRAAVWDVQEMAADPSVSLETLADELSEKEIVIADEIGCGVVPLEKSEREMRERAGRLACMLAERADTVIRVVCGCPQILKGEK